MLSRLRHLQLRRICPVLPAPVLPSYRNTSRSVQFPRPPPGFTYASKAPVGMASPQIPKTQRAIQFKQTGGPEVIEQVGDAKVPDVGPEQVLIKVEWAGVNFIDTYFRGGLYPAELPMRLGNESAGVVAALGSAVAAAPSEYGVALGDRVASYAMGSQAEYVLCDAKRVAKLPAELSTKDGATVLLQGLTALTCMTEAHQVKEGEWILVHAAAGGLGLLFCQIASSLGAHVIGTTSTEEKASLARKNGAEHVVLYGDGRAPISEQILKLTGGEGVHAIFDGVGKSTWEGNFDAIRRKGMIVSVGNASGAVPPFAPLKLGAKNVKVCRPRLYGYLVTQEEWRFYTTRLFDLVSDGKVKITRYLEEGYPFTAEGVRQAHIEIAGRKTVGKLVVKIA